MAGAATAATAGAAGAGSGAESSGAAAGGGAGGDGFPRMASRWRTRRRPAAWCWTRRRRGARPGSRGADRRLLQRRQGAGADGGRHRRSRAGERGPKARRRVSSAGDGGELERSGGCGTARGESELRGRRKRCRVERRREQRGAPHAWPGRVARGNRPGQRQPAAELQELWRGGQSTGRGGPAGPAQWEGPERRLLSPADRQLRGRRGRRRTA